MNHKVSLWAVCAALVTTVTGCNSCQASDATAPAAAQPAPAAQTMQTPTAAKTHKAVTPSGGIVWIVAEWDACCTPCKGSKAKACPTAKCWQTGNGKIICVKPLRKCPVNGKGCPAAEHYQSKAHNCTMCTQDNQAQAAGGKCDYAAKMIQPCPANGTSACKAAEHVNLPNGKKGCAPADQKNPQANAPVELDNSFESDEVFEITSVN